MAKTKNNERETAQTSNGTEYDQETGEIIDVLPEGIEEGLERENVGFPPYWVPALGKRLWARPVALDTRDPKFWRYVLEAGHTTACQVGPSEDEEKIAVQKGEVFTMSVYAALPLERFMGEWVLVTVKDKRDLKTSDQDMWVFTCDVGKDTKKRLADMRAKQGLSFAGDANNVAGLLAGGGAYKAALDAKAADKAKRA